MAGEFDIVQELSLTDDYGKIVRILQLANAPVRNVEGIQINNPVYLNQRSLLRDKINQRSAPEYIPKDELYGIVLDTLRDKETRQVQIFIDVPGLDFRIIEHPDVWRLGLGARETDITFYDSYVYYAASDDVLKKDFPSRGDIARVKVPLNYYTATELDIRSKKYLGTLLKKKIILPTRDVPKGPRTLEQFLKLKKQDFKKFVYANRPPYTVTQQDILDIPFKLAEGIAISSFPVPRKFSDEEVQERHGGLDISMPEGTEIYAGNDSLIVQTPDLKTGHGTYVQAVTDRYRIIYAHLSEKLVEPGKKVKKGEIIGKSGNSGHSKGPHLHLEIRDLANKTLNPLFFLSGTLPIQPKAADACNLYDDKGNLSSEITLPIEPPSYVQKINVLTDELPDVPIPIDDDPEEFSKLPPELATSSQEEVDTVEEPAVETASNKSLPVNRPKMLLVDFDVDKSTGLRNSYNLGSSKIKIREDLLSDLKQIKLSLNRYNIPFSCNAIDIKLNNNNISLLAKVGLQVNLNINSALTNENDLEMDDYFVGPDYSYPIGNGYKLIVYGNVKKTFEYIGVKNIIEKKIIDVYNPKELSSSGPPKIKKIFKSVINITKLFENAGFKPVFPKQDFFLYSDLQKSNWNIFQKPSKITIGYTYRELLSTVYYEDDNPIWRLPPMKWDGNKFI
jgi:murein DD-endopeptidase MepM/ murein hydrolase activator NlpD